MVQSVQKNQKEKTSIVRKGRPRKQKENEKGKRRSKVKEKELRQLEVLDSILNIQKTEKEKGKENKLMEVEQPENEEVENYSKKELYEMWMKEVAENEKIRSTMLLPMHLFHMFGLSNRQLCSLFQISTKKINLYENKLEEFMKNDERGKAEEKILKKLMISIGKRMKSKLEIIQKLYWLESYLYYLKNNAPLDILYDDFELEHIKNDVEKELEEMKQRYINLQLEGYLEFVLSNGKM